MKLNALIAATVLGLTFAAGADTKETGVPAGYPLKKCVISGESLGEMGKAFKVTSDGTDVYLCCKSCLKDFNKNPAKFVAQVKAAQKK
jgi:YHS domain-containing protein